MAVFRGPGFSYWMCEFFPSQASLNSSIFQHCSCFSPPQTSRKSVPFPHLSLFSLPWPGFRSPVLSSTLCKTHLGLDLALSCAGGAEQPLLLRLYFPCSCDAPPCSAFPAPCHPPPAWFHFFSPVMQFGGPGRIGLGSLLPRCLSLISPLLLSAKPAHLTANLTSPLGYFKST